MGQGYGQHLQANDEAVLDGFPCLELFRLDDHGNPPDKNRNWPRIWREHGGETYGGRMIARKDDAIWTNISRFGNPYPPFDYNSGMWTREITRGEAVRLGIIAKDDKVEPTVVPFAKGLHASVKGISETLQSALTASLPGATITDGVLTVGGS